MNRPTGVTVIAVLYFIGAGLMVCVALVALLGGSLAGMVLANHSGLPAGMIAAFGAVISVVLLVFAALYVTCGWGMLKLKEWARIVSIVLACLGLLGGLFSVMHFVVIGVVRLAISGVILWYLLQPHVVAAFRRAATMPPPITAG